MLAVWACATLVGTAGAAQVRATGRVVRDSLGGRPLAGQWVVLHAMTRGGGGPVDSIRTNASGAYAFTLMSVDTSAAYVVSAEYSGIAHFTEPLVLGNRLKAEYGALVVYDTASSGPPVALSVRFVTVAAARKDGAHEVVEAIELSNPTTRTRVPVGEAAVWQGALPSGIAEFRVGESDVSAEAIVRRGDSIAVFAPLAPSGSKQITFAYVLPGNVRVLRVPLDQPVGELLVLSEDTAAAATAPGLEALSVTTVEGRRFARFQAKSVPAGSALEIAFSTAPFRLDRFVPWITALAALVLAAGLWVALRKPRPVR